MRTTNSVCAGICTAGAGMVGADAEASGVARCKTGLPSSPEVGGAEDDAESESGARRSTGLLLSLDDEEDDEEDEDESVEARRRVGRESSEGYDDPDDPELGYDPESLGSGWRITGRGFDDPDPDPEP